MGTGGKDKQGHRLEKFDVGVPCNALSASPDKQLLAVGGREVKILAFSHGELGGGADESGTRSNRPRFRFIKNVNPRRSTNTDKDIQWNPHESKKEWICTVPTNGKIVIWNVHWEGSICILDFVYVLIRLQEFPTPTHQTNYPPSVRDRLQPPLMHGAHM